MATYPASDFPGALDTDIPVIDGDVDQLNTVGKEHDDLHNAARAAILATQAHVLQGITVVNPQTNDYTAVLADAGKIVELTKATAVALTIPPESSVDWPTGTVIGVYQGGAGNVTITAGAGVTIRNLAALRGQYAEASLRYRGSDEWVLEGDLASASAPALKDYAEATWTAGNVNINTTALTAVSTGLDVTLSAAAGDLIEYGINGVVDNGSGTFCLEVYTMPSGSPVNPFGAGLVSGLTDNKQGIPGWETLATGANVNLTGSATRVLAGGDVASGATTLRLYYAKINATARLLYANADIPFKVWAKNYGQV
jgi:hypothetical protein